MIDSRMKLSTIIQNLVDQFGHHFKPRCHCLFCGTANANQQTICQGCFEDLPWLTHCCTRCAEPLAPRTIYRQSHSLCGRCLKKPPAFEQTLCPLRYEFPINSLIQQLKTQAKPEVLELASFLFASRWQETIHANPPDILIPVPLHFSRLYRRGYNQSLELTRSLSKQLGIPCAENSVVRVTAGDDQKNLNAKARRRNLHKAFRIKAQMDCNRVAIVDDVVTTGATADAVAKVLKQNGVRQVEIWCVARTPARR